MFMELAVIDLSKKYRKKTALEGVTLTFGEGVCGLIGPNGSGKSTLMNCLCGAVRPDGGSIVFEGEDVTDIPRGYRAKLRMLYQKPPVVPDYTIRQTMEYGGILYGLEKNELKEQAEKLLERVGLSECTKMKTATLSGGMKQRLCIAQMLLGDAKILLFDEPTAGLDISERLKFKNIVNELKSDHIIIYSTHIYSDLEGLADRLVILESGRVVNSTTVSELHGKSLQEYVETGLETGTWEKSI